MKITIEGFAGEIPRFEPRYLPDKFAQATTAARLERGSLAPVRADVSIATVAAASDRIYLYGSTWLAWSDDADAVQGPVAQDRLYVTRADAAPQMITSGQTYGLAIAPPTTAPILTHTGTVDSVEFETVLYAYTWVTSLGEESAPSPVSAPLDWSTGIVVRVETPTDAPAGRLVTGKRIYRSQTGGSGDTTLFFVSERPVSEIFHDHDLAEEPSQEPLGSDDFDMPPASMQGITAMPNGMMAAFDGREVLFCEPFIPHAWPIRYRLKVNDQIVGLAAFGSSLAVLTTGVPYLIQGIHPDQMAMERSEFNFPCLSKRGIVDMGYAAVYPSVDGLVQIGAQGASLVSRQLWTSEQWRALQPASFRASHQAGRYAFSYTPIGEPTLRKSGFIDMTGEQPFLRPSSAHYADLYHHVETGRLCGLLADRQTVVSVDDDAGALQQYQWLSKTFQLPAAISFSVFQADYTPPPTGVTPIFALSVLRDGVVIRTVTDPAGFHRLPDGLSDRWQIKVDGNHTVTRLVIAGSADELSA